MVQCWPKLQARLCKSDAFCYHGTATNREEPATETAKPRNQRGHLETS